MAASTHKSIDEFFISLASLFESCRQVDHGSILLTQKRLSHDPSSPSSATAKSIPAVDDLSDLNPPHPLPVIMRATNAKPKDKRKDKVKISTVVQPDELEGFYVRYAEACKAGMSGLRKRDRSGRKKAKGKGKGKGADGVVKK